MNTLRNGSGRKNVGNVERILSAAAGAVVVRRGLSRGNPLGFLLAAAGGALLYRAISGHCAIYNALRVDTRNEMSDHTGIKVETSIRIGKPRARLFSYWKRLENLPEIMTNLISVRTVSDGLTHWTAKSPTGREICWDARLINEIPNELIAWKSEPHSQIPNIGSVRFIERGSEETEIRVNLQYYPPSGLVGDTLAKVLGKDPLSQIHEDLKRFKMKMETGTIAEAGDLRLSRECSCHQEITDLKGAHA